MQEAIPSEAMAAAIASTLSARERQHHERREPGLLSGRWDTQVQATVLRCIDVELLSLVDYDVQAARFGV